MFHVQEKEVIQIHKVKKVSVSVSKLELNVGCDILVNMYDINNSVVKQDILILRKDDYSNWANEDNYILNYVCNHYGFIVEPTPPVPVVDEILYHPDPEPQPDQYEY